MDTILPCSRCNCPSILSFRKARYTRPGIELKRVKSMVRMRKISIIVIKRKRLYRASLPVSASGAKVGKPTFSGKTPDSGEEAGATISKGLPGTSSAGLGTDSSCFGIRGVNSNGLRPCWAKRTCPVAATSSKQNQARRAIVLPFMSAKIGHSPHLCFLFDQISNL